MSPIWSFTYLSSIVISVCFFSDAVKLISSRIFSRIVCNLLAPIFSTSSLTFVAIIAISDTASSENDNFTPSVAINSIYCFIKLFSGSLRILIKSSFPSAVSSTLFGNLPCNSGRRSEGFDTWKAPDATNKMWSVLIEPYFVDTVDLCSPHLKFPSFYRIFCLFHQWKQFRHFQH